jgi:threonine synthase
VIAVVYTERVRRTTDGSYPPLGVMAATLRADWGDEPDDARVAASTAALDLVLAHEPPAVVGVVLNVRLERTFRALIANRSHRAAVAPLTQLQPGVFVAELFHGPSLAFKDVAMQILARLYDHLLSAQGRTQTILATSGDTGGAAVEAFAGAERAGDDLPRGRSEVQRRFMTAADEECRLRGGGRHLDDCQAIVSRPSGPGAARRWTLRGQFDRFAGAGRRLLLHHGGGAGRAAPANWWCPQATSAAFAGYALRMGLPVADRGGATRTTSWRTFRRAAMWRRAATSRRPWTSRGLQLRAAVFRGRRAGSRPAGLQGLRQDRVIDIPPRLAPCAVFIGLSASETARMVATLNRPAN